MSAFTADSDTVLLLHFDAVVLGWTPIGNNSTPFTGSFDGQNFTISNLTYDDTVPNLGYAGLFGYVGITDTTKATIQNLNLSNIVLVSTSLAGALIGYMGSADISDVNVNGLSITGVSGGSDNIGGLIGYGNGSAALHSSVVNCNIADFTFTGVDNTLSLGGLMGFNAFESQPEEITITNCTVTNYNFIADTGMTKAGGLIGYGGGLVTNCHAQGEIFGDTDLGGLVGRADGLTLDSCFAISIISHDVYSLTNVGGLVGALNSAVSINNCYANVDISGEGLNQAGGLIGTCNPCTIDKCYSTGIIVAPHYGGQNVGGFIGTTGGLTNISNCYSTVNISGATDSSFRIGGFIGWYCHRR